MAKKKTDIDSMLKFRFSLKHRINLYERLKSYTEEEFPVYESLVRFKARYDKTKDFRGKIIGIWLDSMQGGQSFSKVIKGWVPESEVNLIAAGEDGAGIEKGLGEAIKFAYSAQRIKNIIIGGAMYPMILLFVVLGFIAMFSLQMAPTYLGLLPLAQWPTLPYYFYQFSSFLVNYSLPIGILMGILIFFIVLTIHKWTGSVREFFDNLPPWSVYKVYQACSFLIGMASMMQSGTPLNDSLEKIRKSSSPWLQNYIDEMMRNLRRGGKNFGQHLNVGLLDEETAGDVVDYSELGKFEEAIYSIGEKNLERSVGLIQLKMGIARNLMIVIVGVTVGLIYWTNIELNSTVADSVSYKKR